MIAGHRFLVVLLIFGVHAIGQQLDVLPSDQRKRTQETVASFADRKSKPRLEGAMLEAVEKALLHSFGMKTRPRPTKRVHIPEYIIELYKQHNRDRDDVRSHYNVRGKAVYGANTIRSFYHDQKSPFSHLYPEEGKTHFQFDVKSIEDEENLAGAELRVYREKVADSKMHGVNNFRKHRIDVYEILSPASERKEAITRLLDTRTVGSNRTTWESFDVHPAVLRWRKSPHLNFGLEVHVTELAPAEQSQSNVTHVRLRRSVKESKSVSDWEGKQPFLVAYSDDGKVSKKSRTRRNSKHRSKRKSRKHRRRKQEKLCQRRPLYVDFSDVGWNDWIVAPQGYQAHYCTGECTFPFADHLNTTNHAIVQTLVHSVNSDAAPGACCVPTELSEISMLYLDENEKVVLKSYQEMVVEGCGCR